MSRDIFYYELVDAIKNPGCPICDVLMDHERRTLWTILYERVNDPETRIKFRRSRGLCSYHAWLLYKMSREDPLIGEPGPAIIYQDILDNLINEEFLDKKDSGDNNCFICMDLRETEKNYIEEFVKKTLETNLLKIYEETNYSIMCKYHYREIYQLLHKHDKYKAEDLRRIQYDKLRKLLTYLEKFIESFDYRSKHHPTHIEALSTKLAITTLKGGLITSILRCTLKHA